MRHPTPAIAILGAGLARAAPAAHAGAPTGNRADQHLDRRADQHLDRRADRIDDRLDHRGAASTAASAARTRNGYGRGRT